jgi:hypothetical protein
MGNDLVSSVGTAIATKESIEFAFGLLKRISYPVADKIGDFLAKNAERALNNFTNFMSAVQDKLDANNVRQGELVPPRISNKIVQEILWIDDPFLRIMWAGLMASGCTEKGDDDSNLIFVNLLAELTRLQAHILKFICENSKKYVTTASLIHCQDFIVPLAKLQEIACDNDIHRLDREMDRLSALGLLRGGFSLYENKFVNVTPTPLALHMYVRCQGSRKTPIEFFGAVYPQARPAQPDSATHC